MRGSTIFLTLLMAVATHTAYAVEVNSMRINGAIVSIGDSESSLFKKAGKARNGFRHAERNGSSCYAAEHVYRMDFQEYRIYICDERVFQIERDNV